jgi:tRNA wybutosine-synthesizing protein 1
MSCSDEYISHVQSENLVKISTLAASKLRRAKYGIYNHSAVELCHWTKKSFTGEGTCYKHKFYGISTHRCMEFTPTAMNCENRCVYCWRPTEFYDTLQMPENLVDEPESIVNNLLRERKKLIVGYLGNKRADRAKVEESILPQHYAISLSGEPSMYPKLPQLIRYLKGLAATKSIFLVTNGQEPDMLYRLAEEDSLPTQIYLSSNAPSRRIFHIVNRPKYADAWERWRKSLFFLSQVDTRTVIRITLIRGYNDSLDFIHDFANLVAEGDPHFIELKSYMHIGMSTLRLEASHMLEMSEIKSYSKALCGVLPNFSIMDESEISRIVVLQNNKRSVNRWIPGYENKLLS